MRGWLILSFTFAIGIVLGVGAMTKGPALVAPYLPKSISGQSERIDGEVVRKQREGTRLLVKVATAQGPMLVTFTQKVAELDLLLEPGDRVELITSAYATFVEDPTLERVKRPAGAGVAPSPPSTSSGSPQGSQEKKVR
jgi:hypothetical protein